MNCELHILPFILAACGVVAFICCCIVFAVAKSMGYSAGYEFGRYINRVERGQ